MIITTTDIQLYEILKQKLGSNEAEALVSFVDARIKDTNEQNLKILATRQDIMDLSASTKKDIADLRLDLSLKISETRTEILRWVFAFYIPLLLAIIGLYLRK